MDSNSNGKSLKFLGLTKTQFGIVGLVLVGIVLASIVVLFLKVGEVSERNTRALCATRTYYEKQIAETEKYLDEHPGPEPIQGISRNQLQQGMERQQGLVDSLRFVDCPAPQVVP